MRWQIIAKVIGILLFSLGLCMIAPLLVSLHYNDLQAKGFIISICITIIAGLLLFLISKKFDDYNDIKQKEGMTIVALAWTGIGFFGALPFYFAPEFTSFTDAFFESVSGFTTTGSSILIDIESVDKSILFWRSLIQWLGGMGIIVLSLAILPFLGTGGIQLYKAEVPSPIPDKLTPRLSDSAKILWVLYALITLAETIFLLAGGMPLFEAVCHAFTTMPTGGFSPKNASIGQYNSIFFDYVIIVFMILAGINFTLHYQMLRGKTLAFWKDTECRFFLSLIILLTLLMTFDIYGSVYDSLKDAVRYASFQVVSIITTTGYVTSDYEKFPGFSQVLLFISMFIGACAGSTGGGMKCARIIVCFKYCYREVFKIIHPRSISQVKINGIVVSDEILKSIIGFLCLYIFLFLIASIMLAAMGTDMKTSFGAVAACIGNIGPGFGDVGPTKNFALIPMAGKWVLSWCMLLGRLEIYTIIIIFVPEFWKK